MNRETALNLINHHIRKSNLIKHMFAVEACMGALARYFNEDEQVWAMAGLLHDLDYELTKEDFKQHGLDSEQLLKSYNVDGRIIQAIKAHANNGPLISTMDYCLFSVDPLTGLIVSCALMHPSHTLASLDEQFIIKRFKEKRFAAGADRQQIKKIEQTGLSLDKFISICLNAMQNISKEIGL